MRSALAPPDTVAFPHLATSRGAAPAAPKPVELRVEVKPAGPFRLPRVGGMDGVLRSRGGVLERLLHKGGEPVHVRVAQTAHDAVLFGARSPSAQAARYGIERMRFALGVDEDLSAFQREFARDPLIGRSIRERPWLRPTRRPEPFEALAWAICEQLIEYERAAAIQRRIVASMGPRWTAWEDCERRLRDVPARPHSPAPLRRALSPLTWPAREPVCWCASRARWRRDAWTCTTPITNVHGDGCGRSPGSGHGRWRCWHYTVRVATTSCRRGMSVCSSMWGAASAAAIRGHEWAKMRFVRSSRATDLGKAWRPCISVRSEKRDPRL